MRISKAGWWIPVSLTLLLLLFAAAYMAIGFRNAWRVGQHERSAGLGVASRSVVLFDNAASWRQSRLPSLYIDPSPSPGTIQAFATDAASPKPAAFIETISSPVSTVAIDVDTAAYAIVRQTILQEGRLPEPGAIRIEEMLNYFTYNYPEPPGPDGAPFSVTTEIAGCPWAPANRLLRIGLRSKPIPARNLPPAQLTFLIDVSGSMSSPGKLPLVIRSLALLAEQLRPRDTVAIVVYAGAAGLVLPPTAGSQKQAIHDALARLDAGGSTAGGAGIELAYATARSILRQGAGAINRVILATDGDFNVGPSSDEDLVRLIERERDHGVFLTVLGFGMDGHKDQKLEMLADHGNGHYAYVDSILEARRVLVEELGSTLQTVAKDVKFQVEFHPARVRRYRLIGYANRLLTAEEFRDDRKDAGDLGAGHSVTALYELEPTVNSLPLQADAASLRLRYKEPDARQSREVMVAAAPESSSPSADFRFAAAVAQFGLHLVGETALTAGLASVIEAAEASKGTDVRRAEFVKLVRKASILNGKPAAAN